jgi:hypothetical protein
MMHPTRAGLVKIGGSGFVPRNPEDEARGKDVYHPEGQRIGSAGDRRDDQRDDRRDDRRDDHALPPYGDTGRAPDRPDSGGHGPHGR